jgi:hypothetical protein
MYCPSGRPTTWCRLDSLRLQRQPTTMRKLTLHPNSVSPGLARFAATHASWTGPGITVEDLMVSLADKAWKTKRVPELEDLLVARLTRASGREPWDDFIALDGLLETIGDGAGQRLAFQASFPVHPDLAG